MYKQDQLTNEINEERVKRGKSLLHQDNNAGERMKESITDPEIGNFVEWQKIFWDKGFRRF